MFETAPSRILGRLKCCVVYVRVLRSRTARRSFGKASFGLWTGRSAGRRTSTGLSSSREVCAERKEALVRLDSAWQAKVAPTAHRTAIDGRGTISAHRCAIFHDFSMKIVDFQCS